MNRIVLLVVPLLVFALPAASPVEHIVIQKDRLFSKTELKMKVGDTVVFRNTDEVVHNVFSNTPGQEFDIRRQNPGGSSTVPFTRPGIAEVRCAIHPKMKLVVNVQP